MSTMKWAGSAEGTLGIGFLAAIPADEGGIASECVGFRGFPGLGQFTDMPGVVVRIGA
jgi:hypothetical protein